MNMNKAELKNRHSWFRHYTFCGLKMFLVVGEREWYACFLNKNYSMNSHHIWTVPYLERLSVKTSAMWMIIRLLCIYAKQFNCNHVNDWSWPTTLLPDVEIDIKCNKGIRCQQVIKRKYIVQLNLSHSAKDKVEAMD